MRRLDPLALRLARRCQADVDPLVVRVVARYLAWAEGKLVEVQNDEGEFGVFGEKETAKKIEPAGTPLETNCQQTAKPKKKL